VTPATDTFGRDVAHRYGKDTLLMIHWLGTDYLPRFFALKRWADAIFAKWPCRPAAWPPTIDPAASIAARRTPLLSANPGRRGFPQCGGGPAPTAP